MHRAATKRRGHGWETLFSSALVFAAVAATPSAPAQETDQDATQNLNEDIAEETVGLAFQGYPDAPEFTVVPRKEDLTFYPCAQCHEFMEPNPTIRELLSPHEIELNHGAGRIWCLTCHDLDNRDSLTATLGATGDFDDAHYLCGTCHSNRHKDWYFGAHGKRAGNWQGDRELYSCTHCHDAHDPAIKPREPQPPPGVRIGLEKPESHPHTSETAWERRQNQDDGDEP